MTDIIFTNEGNLAIIDEDDGVEYVQKLFKIGGNKLVPKKHLGLYEHVNYPSIYDNKHCVVYLSTNMFYRIIKIKFDANDCYVVIGINRITSNHLTEMYLFDNVGNPVRDYDIIKIVKILSEKRNVCNVEELCDTLIYEVDNSNIPCVDADVVISRYAGEQNIKLFNIANSNK